MLQKLMAKIAEIESAASPPEGIDIDASEWKPHYSSFTTTAEESELLPLATQSSSFIRGNEQKTLTFPSDTTQEALRKEMENKQGKYLPCHYFDYIGGTSTGG